MCVTALTLCVLWVCVRKGVMGGGMVEMSFEGVHSLVSLCVINCVCMRLWCAYVCVTHMCVLEVLYVFVC